MKFIQVAQAFQTLEETTSRIAMTKILARLFQDCNKEDIKILAYLSQGGLVATYQDVQFNIAQRGILDAIAQLANQSVETIHKKFKLMGDLGLVVELIWQGIDNGYTVREVYEELVRIAHLSGTGSTEKKLKALHKLLQNVDALSAKFIVRIVMKSLRLGFSDMTFLDALSWMEHEDKSLSKHLEDAYNVCADLGLVAHVFKEHGIRGIKAMDIHIGIPIRPAAAERLANAKAIVEKLGHCVAQPKLDGFRVQVHLKKTAAKSEVHFFSRNMLDMSEMFPDLKKIVVQLPVSSLICEGEAIVYEEETDTFLPFQETVRRKRKHDIEQMSEELPLRLYLFDILYLNGQSLLDQTHAHRRRLLENLIKKEKSEVVQIIEQKNIVTAKELEDYFLQNIQAGLEGLVIKRESAIYQPGKRNFNWIKLKRAAQGSLLDTIDCVILGYYVGKGKRAKFGIGAFLVGVYDQKKEMFETVAKVGTGLSDEEWKDLKKKCEVAIIDQKPKNVTCAKELYPDVWVSPSIICTIKSDEITLSPMHTAGKQDDGPGYALRFPRFVTYRFDKSAQDATTITELKTLFDQQKIKG